MAPDNHVNFRLRGIPHDCQSRSEVRELVGSVLLVQRGTNLTIHSLAVNPTERTSRVATLTFNNIPPPLSDNTKEQWVFDLPRNDFLDDDDVYARRGQLVFDTHFSGFTPLQHTEEEDCRVDLVALSGLGGHAFGSFKERNGTFMWLRDALTIDIPVARMMIYGYDTSLKSNRGRPIIFVGHSLGGLVLKEAIIKMKEGNTDEDCEVLQSTSAFLFFGVPHEGMAIESLVPLVGDQPNRALLESLGKNSEVLHRLQDDFKRAFGAVSPKVVSYFETEKSPTAQKEGDIWKLTGPPEVLVDPASAVCGSKDQHPINRNHSEMVKYTSHYDEIYARVRATLERIVGSTRILFDGSTGYGASLFLSDQQQECLRSFSFAEQDQRCKEICVGRETCEWLHGNAKYRFWMRESQGLLWIKGNPGVGKSFLMKFAYTTMRRWVAGELVVSFFFHGRGIPLQRTPIGLFRALLSSTLAFFPEFLSHLMVIFQERETMFGSHRQDRWAWSQRELEGFLTRLLSQETKIRPVTIFVDALDECGRDPARWLLSYFKDLMTDVIQEGRKLRVCFSSRHYPVLGLDVVPTIIVEEQNGKDIRCVIRKQLKEIQPEEERRQLEKEILTKAQGGFQWAVMVASMVADDYAIGINTESLRDRIRTIPQALEELYSEVLNSIPDSEKHQTMKLFEWVLFASRPLVAQELREALVADKDMTCATISDLRRHRDWTNTVEGFERRVKHLSRGLVEFQTREIWEQYEPNGEDFNREAQFIHQSVPEFLQDGGASGVVIFSMAIPLLPGPCHFNLARSCIKYLMLSEVLVETAASRESLSIRFPLASYAVHFFFWHVQETEKHGLSQHDLLSVIRWSPQSDTIGNLARIWETLDPHYTHTPNGWPFFEGTALHVLVALGSMSAFKSFLQEDGAEVDGRDSEGNSPLLLSVREGRYEMALFLIHKFTEWKYLEGTHQGDTPTRSDQQKTGHIDVNAQNNDGDTALTISLMDKANSLTFALIDAGADLEYFGGESSLIFHAIRIQNKQLLISSIERNIRLDGEIHFAIGVLEKDEEVLHDYLSLLLKAGANMSKKPRFKNNICLLGNADQSDISDPLKFDEEAIHQAARYGRMSVIKLLLSHGASANIPNSLGESPLELAVQHRHEEAAEFLFRQAPTTITHRLMQEVACKRMHSSAILFIDEGIFTSIQPMLWYLFSHSHRAASEVIHPEIAEKVSQKIISMLAAGYAVHEGHDVVPHPLISTLEYGMDGVAKALIHRDSTCVNDVNTEGKTALICALQNEKEALSLFLVTEGKASNTGYDCRHRNPLMLATIKGYTAVFEAIFHQEDPSRIHDDNITTLASIATIGDPYLARIMPEPETTSAVLDRDSDGKTILMHAVFAGHSEIVKLLLTHREANLLIKMVDKKGKNALMYASRSRNIEIVRLLLNHGEANALVKMVDGDEKSVLMHAALHENPEMIRLLLNHREANSLIEMVDKNGNDVLYQAFTAGQLHIVNILESMGHMNLVHSFSLSEAVALGYEAATLHMLLRERAAADFPTRHPISVHPSYRLCDTSVYPLDNDQDRVVFHVRDIAPILVATLYNREQAVEILLATGHVSELSCLEALDISQTLGLDAISLRLTSHLFC